ncbi:uncharacterized protein EMH_0027720 [Eimeria mitis]|uniref:Uncharacterized protein n=1 Tax=Eimeria mitis TaxID=44415 RepID=U6KJJ0_9EIME|nr:uncharacterized protein EMH_0027720 [Eimeria mitis]CDJ35623.1 hypothetical protein EMH_0027720 [Eimeria mitis]
MLSLGKKDRYAINFSSLHGECDSSSAAPKPQGDEVDTNGGDTTTNDLKDENRLYALTPKPNVELTENQNPTISAVWALQQAEVEEEKRLLLLEMSQLAIEKQAETKTKERNLQTQLLAQRFEMDLCNGHETFAGGSHPLHKGTQFSDVYSSLMHPVNGSAVPKIEHHIPPNPGAAESCRKIRARFHTLLPIQKEEKLQKTGAPTQRIRTSKQSRWDPAFRAFQASLKTPKPKLYSFPPSKNSVQISRAEQITTDGDDKVHCNGEQQQLQSDFLLKHQHALIGQLLESGISGSQNKAEPPEITAAALSSYACLHACGYRDKHDTSRRVRAIQRRTVLQALQHLLLFPPKTSHRTTLEKGSHLETKGNTPSQESAAA